MITSDIKQQILNNLPSVKVVSHSDYYRHDVIKEVTDNGLIGIELGVAGGDYSQRMVASKKFRKFYGVDLYEDHHNTDEYKKALRYVGLDNDFVLLRMSFDEALDLFDDDYFDFIYVDGYAHTGEEGGKTFHDWYRKLKTGGVFAGDDYHQDWPLVMWAVNDMISQLDCELHITGQREDTNLNRYPSWFFKKPKDREFTSNAELKQVGQLMRQATRKASAGAIYSRNELLDLNEREMDRDPQYTVELIDFIQKRLSQRP